MRYQLLPTILAASRLIDPIPTHHRTVNEWYKYIATFTPLFSSPLGNVGDANQSLERHPHRCWSSLPTSLSYADCSSLVLCDCYH